MSIVLIKGAGAHGVLRAFIDDLAGAFERRGRAILVLDAASGADLGSLLEEAAVQGAVELAFSFGKFGEFKDAAGRSIGRILNAPHVVQLVDYPLTHTSSLLASDPETAFLVVDPSHVRAIRSTFSPGNFPYVGFSPHAAIGSPTEVELDPDAFAAARPIPILFAGTFYKPGVPAWREMSMPADVQVILEKALELALSVEWMPALDALDAVMKQRGLDPEQPQFASFRWLAAYIHEYVRLHRRFELLKAVAKLGLPVHLYGSGYDSDLYRFKKLTYGGEASFDQINALMRRSQIVLNANANFGAGSHERPLSALMNGAAPVSDHSLFYTQALRPGEDIFLYNWLSLISDLEKVGQFAADPTRVWAMARAGQRRVVADHRWDNRINAILQAADAVRNTNSKAG